MNTATRTELEQQSEAAALLTNCWNGIEMEVKARCAARISKTLIEAHYRENSLPNDALFIAGEAPKLGFSTAQSADKTAYIFRRINPRLLGIGSLELERRFKLHSNGETTSGDIPCTVCFYRFDEHPSLGTIKIENGSRYLKLIARGTCHGNLLFEKALEI
ncbi:MAG TPA: hypothetical protein VF648_18900 [Pyrinomonadaceae bacterium]|jgi:hypothetical protein